MKWLDIIKVVVPVVLGGVNPALIPLAGVITSGIGLAEQIPGQTGAQKLNTVVALAGETAVGVNSAAGKQVIDPTQLEQAVSLSVSAGVQVANLFKTLPGETQLPPPPPLSN